MKKMKDNYMQKETHIQRRNNSPENNKLLYSCSA